MQVFILAAGLGSRLRPFTHTLPKALVEVKGQPMLYHLLHRLKKQGWSDIVINIHHHGKQIVDYLVKNEYFGMHIRISDEQKVLLDTGGALIKALPLFNSEEIMVHNVDVFTDMEYAKIIQYHREKGADATMAVRDRKTTRMLFFDAENRLHAWRNTQTGETIGEIEDSYTAMAFSGIHVIKRSFIEDWAVKYQEHPKFSVIASYVKDATERKVIGYPHDADHWMDLGKAEQLGQINFEF